MQSLLLRWTMRVAPAAVLTVSAEPAAAVGSSTVFIPHAEDVRTTSGCSVYVMCPASTQGTRRLE